MPNHHSKKGRASFEKSYMLKGTGASTFQRQASLIVLGSGLVIAFVIIFGMMALSHLASFEKAWVDHSKRATAIGQTLSRLERHIGYGGFIHHLKNAVLRLDLDRYQVALEKDIAGLTVDFELISTLLKEPEDQEDLALVRATFDEYIRKYRQIEQLIPLYKDPVQIDNLIKVSDKSALDALTRLANRAGQRTQNTKLKADQAYSAAALSLRSTGILLTLAVLVGMLIMIIFLRRIILANERIFQAQERLDLLLAMSPDPMLTISPDGRIIRANDMAQKFFGYSTDELQSMAIEALTPLRCSAEHLIQKEGYFGIPSHLRTGEQHILQVLTKGGSKPDVEVSFSHSGEGDDQLATLSIRDVTEREQNRLALDLARSHAEDALMQQKQLQEGLVEAEKMAALGGLVAGIAHEINTPIGVTLTSATHLESETKKADALYKAGEMTEEVLSDYFATANQVAHMMTLNTQRASALIHSFKQVAVDQTADECRLFNLAEYIDEIILSLRPHLKKTPIKVQVDCLDNLSVYSNPGGLSQILTNLVTNSLRYAFEKEQPGNIMISVQATDSEVTLIYQDDGKGISHELQKTVFEPFITTGRSSGGSGLGLYIVYNTATQVLRGTVDLVSAPGEGVRFTVRFPRTLPDTQRKTSS